jgi:hypothetical protein
MSYLFPTTSEKIFNRKNLSVAADVTVIATAAIPLAIWLFDAAKGLVGTASTAAASVAAKFQARRPSHVSSMQDVG